jgi:hypothetical protein
MKIFPRFYALIAAGIFGASMPFLKLLLGKINPLQLAGLLYFGGGTGLLVYSVIRDAIFAKRKVVARFNKNDIKIRLRLDVFMT